MTERNAKEVEVASENAQKIRNDRVQEKNEDRDPDPGKKEKKLGRTTISLQQFTKTIEINFI